MNFIGEISAASGISFSELDQLWWLRGLRLIRNKNNRFLVHGDSNKRFHFASSHFCQNLIESNC